MITLVKPATKSYSSVIVSDTISGDKDGVNKTFNTTYDYKSGRIDFMYNGQALKTTVDFEESGPNEITLLHIAPYDDDILSATYELKSATLNPGSTFSGVKQLLLGDDTKYISFSKVLPSTNYKLNVDLITTSTEPSVYSFVIADKSTTGFRVYFSGEIESTEYSLEWSVV